MGPPTGVTQVGLILLAAGVGQRFGGPKLLATVGGESLLQRATRAALQSGCRPLVVVVGAYRDLLVTQLAHFSEASWVDNPHWHAGMASSIGVGLATLRSLAPNSAATIIGLADQPLVEAHHYAALVHRYRAGGGSIVAARYANTVGAPVLFAQVWFDALAALRGDQGAKCIVQQQWSSVALVDLTAAAFDVDCPSDLLALRQRE